MKFEAQMNSIPNEKFLKEEIQGISPLEGYFSKIPSTKEILNSWDNPKELPSHDWVSKERFSKIIDDKFEFLLTTREDKKNKDIFEVSFELLSEDESINELNFYKNQEKVNGLDTTVWDLNHRNVRSQAEGISGSMFLNYTEEFLRVLMQNKRIEMHPLFSKVSQPKVLSWMQKNGFLLDSLSELRLKEIKESDQYRELPLHIVNDDHTKDPFWINKNLLEDKDLMGAYGLELTDSDKSHDQILVARRPINTDSLPHTPLISIIKEL